MPFPLSFREASASLPSVLAPGAPGESPATAAKKKNSEAMKTKESLEKMEVRVKSEKRENESE